MKLSGRGIGLKIRVRVDCASIESAYVGQNLEVGGIGLIQVGADWCSFNLHCGLYIYWALYISLNPDVNWCTYVD